MDEIAARNPRAEATALLGPGLTAAVLEPSPPAVNHGPWFADDPPNAAAEPGTRLVGCTRTCDVLWDEVVATDASLVAFARAHWLTNFDRLPSVPANLAATRTALTALAFFVVAPARHAANGKIGLRWTKGGFGTPFFGANRQVRVAGDRLVVQDGDRARAVPLTTLREAGQFVGVSPGAPSDIDFHDAPDAVDPDQDLEVSADAVAFLDAWFGFATRVLEELRVEAGMPDDTRVQIWPEHFDAAIELGAADAGTRASFGASPGDAAVPMPYLYVAPWTARQGPFWDAPFGGAMVTIDELQATGDGGDAARQFFAAARTELG